MPMPRLPVGVMKIEEVACAVPPELPTRKLPAASAFETGVKPKIDEVAT